jgi:hypothetical protein
VRCCIWEDTSDDLRILHTKRFKGIQLNAQDSPPTNTYPLFRSIESPHAGQRMRTSTLLSVRSLPDYQQERLIVVTGVRVTMEKYNIISLFSRLRARRPLNDFSHLALVSTRFYCGLRLRLAGQCLLQRARLPRRRSAPSADHPPQLPANYTFTAARLHTNGFRSALRPPSAEQRQKRGEVDYRMTDGRQTEPNARELNGSRK